MADSKTIAQLAALTTPDGGDLLAIVDDPSGSPVTKKITADNLLTLQSVRVVSVALTDAQIKALPTTRVTILAAAASGYRHKLIGASLYVDNAGAIYTNISDYCALALKESTGGWLTPTAPLNTTGLVGGGTLTQMTELLGSTPGQRLFDFPLAVQSGQVYDASAYAEIVGGLLGVGTPTIDLWCDNDGGGDFTGGDAANSGRVTLYYAVEAVA